MKKTILREDVLYTIAWSRAHRWDKYESHTIVPELPGIVALCYIEHDEPKYLMFYSCWRDGCRLGLKRLVREDFTRFPALLRELDFARLHYRYTVIDTSAKDIQDVLFWLLKTYQPHYNNHQGYEDSKRYRNITVTEMNMGADDVVERLPGRLSR